MNWVRDNKGELALAELAQAAGVTNDDLLRGRSWIPYHRFVLLLGAARELMPDEETFRRACTYRMSEAYGPLRFVTWALSPSFVFSKAMTNLSTLSQAHRAEIVSIGRDHARGRYYCLLPEHRLVCVSRMAQAEQLPTLWGLPAARLIEHSCAAQGGDCCDYEVRWSPPTRWWKVGLAAILASAGTHLVSPFVSADVPPELAAGAFVALAGALWATRLERRAQYQNANDLQEAMRNLALDEAEARQQLVAIRSRESAWNAVLEREVQTRTERLGALLEKLEHVQQERVVTLRGFTHDLKNPLSVLKAAGEYLEPFVAQLGPEGRELLEDHASAVQQMERLIRETVTLVSGNAQMISVRVQAVDVHGLVDDVRRRLHALAFGRDIKVSVFSTRDAPDSINADTLILDRIVDNLLTNAVKYTARGSIVVEFDGTADFLTMKISDSGRGIAESALHQIFLPDGSSRSERAPGSNGVGLSVVAQLLDLVGGRLDVMSKPGRGTTFWIYFPIETRTQRERPASAAEILGRVVRIRRTPEV